MNSLYLAIIVAMIGFHVPVAWIYVHATLKGIEPRSEESIRSAIRPYMWRLVLAWLVVITGYVIWFVAAPDYPNREGQMFFASIILFHLLWWPFVVPILQRLPKELQAQGIERAWQPSTSRRTASLTPRTAASYLSPWMLALPIAVATVGFIILAWRMAIQPPEALRTWLMAATFACSSILFFVLWSWWIRKEISLSYPVDEEGAMTAQRIDALESLRRFRVLGIFWLMIAAMSVFLSAAVMVIEVEHGTLTDAQVGWMGGLTGTVVGLGGGVFGIWASIRGHRAARIGNPATAQKFGGR